MLRLIRGTRLFKKAHAVFDQGRGFEDLRGRGVAGIRGDFVIFSDGFF